MVLPATVETWSFLHSSGVEPALQGVSETQKLTEEQDRPGEQMRQGSRLCFLLQ
jgi:hypothetical protein